MNNCQAELVWLVSNRLKPVNKPIKRITILGPYLSEAQPPKKAHILASIILVDRIVDVTVRVRSNSLAMDLKKTPKESCMPRRTVPIIRKVITTTQP